MKYRSYLKEVYTDALKDREEFHPVGTVTSNDCTDERVSCVNGVRYYVGKSPATLAKSKAIFAVTLPAFDAADRVYPFVVTDGLFDQLSENAKEFVMMHEEGHIENGDLDVIAKMMLSMTPEERIHSPAISVAATRNISAEFDADDYAASVIGYTEAAAALMELKGIMKNTWWVRLGNASGIREMQRRIDRMSDGWKRRVMSNNWKTKVSTV